MIIDYEKFLSMKFDLVIRWHLLEEVEFSIQKVKVLVISDQYEYLRNAFSEMMPVIYRDVADPDWGTYFFRPMGHWSWIEDQMKIGDYWIKENPYNIGIDGLGFSTKRFILVLKYERQLYWVFSEKYPEKY